METIEKSANEISRVTYIIEKDANNEFNGIIERLCLDEGNKYHFQTFAFFCKQVLVSRLFNATYKVLINL